MKRFSEFNITTGTDKNIFVVPVISIEELINCEVEILDFEKGVKTRHGENRYVVKVKHEGVERKFFTNAAPIKEALDQVSKSDFPFITVVKQQRFGSGSGKTFYFT